MRDIIEIEKELIPYDFDIILGSEIFNFEIKWNEIGGFYTITLSKDDNVLVYDEPVVYGVTLFKDVFDGDTYPCIDIVPYDESGQNTSVTKENFNVSVFLTIDDEQEEIV